MAVRRRNWVTTAGAHRESWIVDYADQNSDRHIQTFSRKKDADAFHASVQVDVRLGIHTPASKSPTLGEAADLFREPARTTGSTGPRWIPTASTSSSTSSHSSYSI